MPTGATNPRILHLTLKKRWFDLISSGVKKEEYRELKPYWHKRLLNHLYDFIQFRNGYAPEAPTILVELLGLSSGLGITEWGAPDGVSVYILRLGKVSTPS